jgi:hypothetical protein
MMHAWAKVIRLAVVHAEARPVVTAAQRLVTFVRALHAAQAAIRQLYATLKITGGGLQTSNTTRLTSVIQMLASVLRLKAVLQALVSQGGLHLPPDVKATIDDAAFWRTLEGLCKLLRPVEEVR